MQEDETGNRDEGERITWNEGAWLLSLAVAHGGTWSCCRGSRWFAVVRRNGRWPLSFFLSVEAQICSFFFSSVAVKLTGEKDGKRLRKNDSGIGSASGGGGRPRLKTVILHLFLRAFFSLFSLHCVSFFFCSSFTLSFPLSCSFPCFLPFRFSFISVSFVLFCFLFFFFLFCFCFLCFFRSFSPLYLKQFFLQSLTFVPQNFPPSIVSPVLPCIYRQSEERVTIPYPSAGHGNRGMGLLFFIMVGGMSLLFLH